MRALAVAVVVALAAAGGAAAAPSALQCAGIAARTPDDIKRSVIGAIDQPGREAAVSNLDIVVVQLEQLPQYTGKGVETITCVAGAFLGSTSERDPRWKIARANLRAWLKAHEDGVGGARGR